ncbi:MAG: type IV pilus assembly protein PilM [Deltaproteobacteria bacterium]|nr:type IV pilus assembly protein PilM [Deltaproteobacteria bacterium]
MKSKGMLGLDIGSSSIKVVEMTSGSKGMELLKLGVVPLPPDAIVQGDFLNVSAIVDGIREAVSMSGSNLKNVATSVSGHSVIVKRINLPKMSREELEESLAWEAEQYIPFDVSEVNLDFQILSCGDAGEVDETMDILLVAVKKELIDNYTAAIVEAGLNPCIVEVAGFSVENAFEANYDPEPDEAVALVNVGSQVVNINVVINGSPAFTRDIATGGSQYTEEIQKSLSIGYEEAERMKKGDGAAGAASQDVIPQEVEQAMRGVTDVLVGEIMRSLDFFSATSEDAQVKRIMLSGGSAKVIGFQSAFQERTNIPVEIMDPLARVTPSKFFDSEYLSDIGPSLGVGVGLALRKADF